MLVGFREGICFDETRSNWDATGYRPLAWSAWYPAAEGAIVSISEGRSWFRRPPIACDAQLRSSGKPLPLVLLSHGSGGSTIGMEWLAHRLAQRGYVALAVNHHGHTGTEPYRAEGFCCLWERAADLSELLSDCSWREALGEEIEEKADVAGFSAGAYTAMLLMGAQVAYSQFEPDNPVGSPIRGPMEFPNLADELPRLHGNPIFQKSWERRRDDYSDARFRSATVFAPGRSVLGFAVESLRNIRKPVQIIGGDADTVAPATECCEWLRGNVPGSTFETIAGGVGHYTFLPEGSEIGVESAPELFRDGPSVVRSAVHDYVTNRAVEFMKHAS